MKIAILTTNTLHHCYYLQEINKLGHQVYVFSETTSVRPSFKTQHPFELERENYESEKWFDGKKPQLEDFQTIQTYKNINDANVAISQLKPDLVLIFGTRRLNTDILRICGSENTWNLHGGNPLEYRGLDSHMWAIYHNDFSQLQSCLHYTTPNLDEGQIISMENIPITKDMKLKHLRSSNTQVCINMTKSALSIYKRSGKINTECQVREGRYYSFMPEALKHICKQKFERYTHGKV